MRIHNRNWLSAALLLTLATVCGNAALAQAAPPPAAAAAAPEAVATYPSCKAAASAFITAVKANDSAELKRILGEKASELLSSGDPARDEQSRLNFIKNYDAAHAFTYETKDKAILTVGTRAWPLPFPIVRANGVWSFDAEAGARELAYRRIGHNELDAIKVVQALVDAQKSYAASGHDGDPPGAYAQRIRSKAGTQNGLYWDVKDDETPSPAGDLIAEATSEGATEGSTLPNGKPTPFHGYYYRILRTQGEHAPGGAKDYVTDGRMTGGFAILAWPAEYGRSGVMTFMASKRGKLYQSDLGADTETAVKGLRTFDPDSNWRLVP
jgi:Protein of unknown function (DUF2950)